jgi:hypothetical protein
MRWLIRILLLLGACGRAFGGSEPGLPLKYVGGTFTGCALKSSARLYMPGSGLILRCMTAEAAVDYERITALRYSQTAHWRWAETAAAAPLWPVAPLVFANRAYRHFVTIEYTGADGARQALVLLVAKRNILALLADLKARAARPIEYEDRDPRK